MFAVLHGRRNPKVMAAIPAVEDSPAPPAINEQPPDPAMLIVSGVDLPKDLVDAQRAGRLVIFAGAGVSMGPPS
ncbi:MAG: hypothetical protein ABIT71_08340, partial [Vicinamibacteraceae bacterium]